MLLLLETGRKGQERETFDVEMKDSETTEATNKGRDLRTLNHPI